MHNLNCMVSYALEKSTERTHHGPYETTLPPYPGYAQRSSYHKLNLSGTVGNILLTLTNRTHRPEIVQLFHHSVCLIHPFTACKIKFLILSQEFLQFPQYSLSLKILVYIINHLT